MPDASHLNVALFFASGTAELNAAALSKFASRFPDFHLVVVAEFEPACGEWIPFHVQRALRANIDSIRASLGGRVVAHAACVFARGTALGAMRVAAAAIARDVLFAYEEHLGEVRWKDLPAFALRSFGEEWRRQFSEEGRGRKWLRRLARPSEAEIPVRARLAQARGAASAKVRGEKKELPLIGVEPLMEGVCVVIPSRDGLELLREMLPHLVGQVSAGEIVVVDNGSSDGTAEWLRGEYPAVRVIVHDAPLSFARAINGGVESTRFRRLIMLNNDMIVAPGFVSALENAFHQAPELFCATAQIFFPEGVRREETGKAVWRSENPLDFPVRCDDPVDGEDLTWVLYGSGGCSQFDTRMLRELGGVSEVYDPAYVEDMDFGYRAWKRGWATVYCAGARVEHRHRATTSRFFSAEQLDFFVERNYLRFLIHAIGSAELFQRLWREGIRRLQLRGDLETLRHVPKIEGRPSAASGTLSEEEILALGNGDAAAFPGKAVGGKRTVLIASPYLPYPLSHGGAVRMFHLMREAAVEFDLVLIAFCDSFSTPASELLDFCREVVLIRRHGSHYRKDTELPDVVEEFDSLTFRAYLKQSCVRWKPSVVQLEYTWMASYADCCGGAKTVLVEHDITFDLQRQLLKTAPSWELERQAEKWERFERAAWGEVDQVVVMSAGDASLVPGAVMVPNGVDCLRFQPEENLQAGTPVGLFRLLFIGSFAHLPNVLALNFFLREVWPLLPETFTLHVITGIEYPFEPPPRVTTEAFVADVRPAYIAADIVIAPLVASAGTNIKVLEAMAMGKPLVATPAGVNGLPVHPGLDCVVSEDPQTLASEIVDLTANQPRSAAIGATARHFATQYDWAIIGKAQRQLYDSLRC